MVTRRQWVQMVEAAWKERPLVWLAGVRRVGKTCLSQSLPDIAYFDCELPRVRQMMMDPQGFWESLQRQRVVLDEVHRLPNPSELLGLLWEHFVLNELLAALQGEPLHSWRDKAGHEVDFVLKRRGQPPVALECKWSASELSTENLQAFRRRYPDGENVVVAQDADRPVIRALRGIRVRVEPLPGLIQRLRGKPGKPAR